MSRVPRQWRLSVGQRLVLAVLPALLAVVLVVALSYYGELGRQAPERVVGAAAALALASLLVTWRNTHYLARRIERLAGRTRRELAEGAIGADELDRIEETVDRLRSALEASESERTRAAAAAEARLVEQAELLAAASKTALRHVEDARLPLHILLDASFGELTANQEELLADARDAAAAAGEALRRFCTLADVDRDGLAVRCEWVAIDEVLGAVLAPARAEARRRGVPVRVHVEPALPRVVGDRTRLTEALALLLGAAMDAAGPDAALTVTAARMPAGVALAVEPVSPGVELALARRLLERQGAQVTMATGAVRLVLRGG